MQMKTKQIQLLYIIWNIILIFQLFN